MTTSGLSLCYLCFLLLEFPGRAHAPGADLRTGEQIGSLNRLTVSRRCGQGRPRAWLAPDTQKPLISEQGYTQRLRPIRRRECGSGQVHEAAQGRAELQGVA